MKTQNPWMGRMKGSAGSMTGCKMYDKNVMRAKAFEVSNPKTQAQQTERRFFAEVMQCVASVSEAELRSLFGVKPKGMSRRNALTKQVSEAYNIDGTSKSLDFSKLLSIGNGEKVTTPIYQIVDGTLITGQHMTLSMFGNDATEETNIIAIGFDSDNNRIIIVNQVSSIADVIENTGDAFDDMFISNGFVYATCAVGGGNVHDKGFGSFIIKTRNEKPEGQIQHQNGPDDDPDENPEEPEPQEVPEYPDPETD